MYNWDERKQEKICLINILNNNKNEGNEIQKVIKCCHNSECCQIPVHWTIYCRTAHVKSYHRTIKIHARYRGQGENSALPVSFITE